MLQNSVKGIMEAKVLSLPPEETLSKALSLMADNNISFIVIASEENKPLGLITERDILKNVWNKQADDLQVTDVMSSPVLTISPDEDVMSAIHTLVLRNIRHLVVVDKDKKICGVLTLTDFLQKLGFEYFVDFKDVGEIMDSSPLTLPADAEAFDALSSLSRTDASCLIAMEGNRPAGIFTERDALRITRDGQDLSGISLREIMKSPVIHVQESSCVFEALSVMNKNKIRHLPVINSKGELSGLTSQVDVAKGMELSYTGFMKKIIEAQERKIREANERLEEKVAERTGELTETNERLQREIEERKRVEERLRLLEKALETTNMGVTVADTDGRIIYTNPADADMHGYSSEELMGEDIGIFAPIKLRKTLTPKEIEAAKTKKRESVNIRKDGSTFPVYLISDIVKSNSGDPIGFVTTCEDITERKEGEATFQLLIESFVGKAGQEFFSHIVSKTCSWLGADCAIIGELVDEDKVEALAMVMDGEVISNFSYLLPGTPCEKAAEKGLCIYPDKVSDLFPDDEDLVNMGARGYIGIPLTDEKGKTIGIFCAISRQELNLPQSAKEAMEIIAAKASAELEHKQSADALKKSEERYKRAEIAGNVGSWDWNILTGELHWSDMIFTIFGFRSGEFGATYEAFLNSVHPDDRQFVVDSVNAAVEEDKDYAIEHRIAWPDKTVRWVSETGAVFRNEEGKAVQMLGVVKDITESKQAEEALRESEARFRSMFESDMVGTFFWDANGEISDANNAFLSIVGYSREDLLSGKLKWSELTPPEYTERDNEALKELAEKELITPYEKEYIHKSGRRIPIVVGAATFPRATASGVAFILDITERKKAEEGLLLYESTVSTFTDMLALLDKEFLYMAANPAYLAAFNMTYDEVVGHTVSEVFGEKFFNEVIRPNAERCLAGEEINYQAWFDFPAYESRYMDIHYYPYTSETGEFIGFIVNARNITERKQAEKELQESEERFRAVFDNALDGILLAEKETRKFLTGNREICYMLGYTLEEIKQLGVNDIHPAESLPQVKEQFYKQTRGEIEVAKDIPVKRKDGGIFYADIKSSSVTLAGKTYMVGLFRDITERKQAEEELHKAYGEMEHKVEDRTKDLAEANSKLKELDKLKSMFIASMSHELRTPLNAIIGFTGVILQGMVGDLNDKQEDQLGRVYRNARHLLALITDVIDISKLEAGKISPFAEDFILKEVIDEAVDDLIDDIEMKGLDIEVNVPPELKMKSDRRRMLECTVNLLSNAAKYTEEGKITIDVKRSGEEIEVSVSDTGIGIAEEDMDKLFMPFERLNSHLRTQTPGTGLGLYLCKSLSREVLGGDVSVRSEPGKGSTFTLRVPKEIQTATATAIQSIKEGGKEQ